MKRDLPSECGGCGLEERWLFHHVCVRNSFRRICTSCVLKLHSGSFCPICFEVYEESHLPAKRVVCLRCPSVTHLDCVSEDAITTYVCPPCSNPNFTFFDSSRGSDGNECHIDTRMAKVLAAAAQIAWVSIGKAARSARMESDRRVKEAASKRKEAREALERFTSLVSKEKKCKETMTVDKATVPVTTADQKKSVKGSSALSAAVMAQKRLENQLSVEANVKSGRVAGPSNSVASTGKREKVEGSSMQVMGTQQPRNSSKINEKNASYLPQVQNNVVLREKEENGLFSVPTESQKLQHPVNGPDTKGQANSNGFTDSETGHQIPQPSQDLLVRNSNEGVQMGSSNTTT